MNNPVSCGLLSNALLHEGLLAAKEFHGQLVVRRLEEGLQLVADERRLGLAAHVGRPGTRSGFLFRCAVKADIVPSGRAVAKVHSSAAGHKAPGRTASGRIVFVDEIHVVCTGHQIVRHE